MGNQITKDKYEIFIILCPNCLKYIPYFKTFLPLYFIGVNALENMNQIKLNNFMKYSNGKKSPTIFILRQLKELIIQI